jgi:hypothetical protein
MPIRGNPKTGESERDSSRIANKLFRNNLSKKLALRGIFLAFYSKINIIFLAEKLKKKELQVISTTCLHKLKAP